MSRKVTLFFVLPVYKKPPPCGHDASAINYQPFQFNNRILPCFSHMVAKLKLLLQALVLMQVGSSVGCMQCSALPSSLGEASVTVTTWCPPSHLPAVLPLSGQLFSNDHRLVLFNWTQTRCSLYSRVHFCSLPRAFEMLSSGWSHLPCIIAVIYQQFYYSIPLQLS